MGNKERLEREARFADKISKLAQENGLTVFEFRRALDAAREIVERKSYVKMEVQEE